MNKILKYTLIVLGVLAIVVIILIKLTFGRSLVGTISEEDTDFMLSQSTLHTPSPYLISTDASQDPILLSPYIAGAGPYDIGKYLSKYSCTSETSDYDSNFGGYYIREFEKIINERVYCMHIKENMFGAGEKETRYTYTTDSLDGSGPRTATFLLRFSNCALEEEIDECDAIQSNFYNSVDDFVDSLF